MTANRSRRITWISMVVLLCTAMNANAATYFTRVAAGNWNVNSTWSTVGFGGTAAGATPGALDIVFIGAGSTVTLTAAHSCAQLTLQDGGILQLGGFIFTVTGNTVVGLGATAGTITTTTSGAGTKTFTGLVTVNAAGVWNLSGQNPATSFAGGITVAAGATFNNGTGATAFSLSQNLAGGGTLIFGGTITPAAATTVTNNVTGSVVVNGSIVLTGNLTQGNNGNLNLTTAAPFSGLGTFNASTNFNTVTYSGAAQTVKAVTYRQLVLSGSGVKTMTGVTSVQSNFNMSGSATATTVITTILGNINLQGTSAMTTNSALVVSGALTVGAGATLNLGGFAFAVGTITNVTGTVNSVTAATGTKAFAGAVTINAGGVWNLSAVNPATSFNGGIIMNGTTFNNGTGNATFQATQSLQGTVDMIFGGQVIPAAGQTLTNLSSANVTIAGNINLAGNFTQGANAKLLLTGANPITNTTGTFNATTNSNVVNYSGTNQTVRAVAYNNLTLSNSGTKTMTNVDTITGDLTITGTAVANVGDNMTVTGDLILNAGATFVGGNFITSIAGDWVNNGGTFTNTNSSINMIGTSSGVGGTTPTTFNNLSVGAGTATLTVVTTVSGIFNVDEGAKAGFNGLTTHTANRVYLGRNGQSAGTYGGTGSGATFIYPAYFVATSGRITAGVSSTQSLPFVETFAGEADGSVINFVPPWTVTQSPGSGTFQKESPIILIGDDGFEINNTGATEGVWQTADLDIPAGVAEIAITMDITALNTSATDYVKVLYVFDVGPSTSETLLTTVSTTTTSPALFVPATGHTKFRLVIRGKDNTSGTLLGIPYDFTVDNINIIGMRHLFSRANAAWGTSGTWSTVGINGADCACTPSAAGTDRVFIGGAKTVTMGAGGAAASVQVNGTTDAGGIGTLNLGTQSLRIDLGGYLTVNAGGTISSSAGSSLQISDKQNHTITNNGIVSIGNFNVTNNSLYTAMSNTVNGTGSFTITGNVTTSTAFLGGNTLNINMPLTIGGQVNLALLTEVNNNSTVSMTATFADVLTGFGTWTQGNNAVLNYAGSTLSVLTFDAANPGNFVNYNGGGNQTIDNTTYWHITLSNAGTKSLNGDINVHGNWLRSGTATFNGSGNEVEFNAPATGAAQTITSVGTETFSNLRINSSFATSPQLTFANNNVTVSGELTFSQGHINLNTKVLTLGGANGLTHNGNASSGWAYNGTITRAFGTGTVTIGNDDGLLPMGTSTNFRPFYFGKSNPASSSGTISLTHSDAGTTTAVSIADTNPAATIIIRREAPWKVTTTGGGTAAFDIRYGGDGLGVVTNVTHLRSMLLNSVIASNVAGSGTTTSPRVQRTGLTAAQMTNDFYIGSSNAASSLPVTIVSFEGVARNFGVELSWKTESEINNDYFTVLHSKTGLGSDFSPIGTVTGSGTTNEEHKYSFIHNRPVTGKNYYMLRQTDFDGKNSAAEAIVVDVSEVGSFISIYPNPLRQDRTLNVVLGSLEPGASTEFHVLDMRGMTIRKTIGVSDETGIIKVSFDFADMPVGLYVLKVRDTQFKFAVD